MTALWLSSHLKKKKKKYNDSFESCCDFVGIKFVAVTTNRFNFCRKISNESEGEREGRVNSSRRKKNSKPEESGAGESVTADGPGERNSSKDKYRRTCYLFIIGCPRNRVAYNELSLQYWM